ncbi:MAG TPA: hypothetical protein VFL63_05225 [Rhodanobacteraceae bacterium]|jgi:hypothetical protein|nr:hypothetical protein [Rhodanobacteraceae bacterium]
MRNPIIRIDTGRGLFVIDQRMVHVVIHDWAYWAAMGACSHLKRARQYDWYNPMSWGMPDVVSLDVDWHKVDIAKAHNIASATQECQRYLDKATAQNYCAVPNASGTSQTGLTLQLRDRLYHYVSEAQRLKQKWHRQLCDASAETMRNVKGAVSGYGKAIAGATFVRDASGDVLMLGATLASGGTATALLAAGSVYKGSAKFQDTRSVGAAVFEATTDFTVGLIPDAAPGAKRVEKVMVAVVKGQLQIAGQTMGGIAAAYKTTGVVNGKTIAKALTNASLQTVGGMLSKGPLDKITRIESVKTELEHMSFPAAIRIIRRGTLDTVQSKIGETMVDYAFDPKKQERNGQGPNPAIGIGDPCLADLAIQGPYYSAIRRPH